MSNQFYKGQKNNYTVLRELGKGGEGTVYELAGNTSLVLKVYTEPLAEKKARKLGIMAGMYNPRIEEYAAWPVDVVTDNRNIVVGFAMTKLVDYYPLHMLFSPMDRKKIFPDKGYNFLVHVARNLAAAFQSLHSAGLVVGDVNEGNILVNARGMVAFIDCDSFQLNDGAGYHFCEVGVPRYTPPELLANTSFANVVRTPNTDSFSMAILIFQLLFLGRHPFAGKNRTTEDIDEETAIKQHLFAFSLRNKNNKLSPPNDSLGLQYLNEGLVVLFHNAFEKNGDRPQPYEWIKELDVFLKSMVTCGNTKLHTYPAKLTECIWCAFKEKRNILYFFDDTYLQNSQLLQDIDKFVNGFRVDRIQLSKIDASSLPVPNLLPAAIDKKFIQFKKYQHTAMFGGLVCSLGLGYFNGWYSLIGVIATVSMLAVLPWRRAIQKELATRKAQVAALQTRFYATIEQHNQPAEFNAYGESSRIMLGLIEQFRNLPKELLGRRKALEERLYNQQLHIFLSRFYVQEHKIPSFGEARKKLLYSGGILNAADISKLNNNKIQGIGPAYMQVLFSWQRQVGSTFVYRPDNDLLNREFAIIGAAIEDERKRLENTIRTEFQSFQFIKQSITNKQGILKKQAAALRVKLSQAELDFEAFKKAVGVK